MGATSWFLARNFKWFDVIVVNNWNTTRKIKTWIYFKVVMLTLFSIYEICYWVVYFLGWKLHYPTSLSTWLFEAIGLHMLYPVSTFSTNFTVFENHPKSRIWIFVPLVLTCLVTLFYSKLQIYKKTRQKCRVWAVLMNFCPLKM